MEKAQLLRALGRTINGAVATKNSMRVPQKIKNFDPAIPILHIYPKEWKAVAQIVTRTPCS